MNIAAVVELVEAVSAVDEQAASRDELCAAVAQLGRLRSWVQSHEMRLAQGMARVSAFPEQTFAEAGRVGLQAVSRLVERADTAASAPGLGAAVQAGLVSGEHVDALTRVLRTVEPDQRPRLVEIAERLVPVAAAQTADDYAKRLRAEARRLQRDDGMTRLQQQRRATRLSTWTDAETGMWNLRGVFDPVTGLTLARVLDAALDQQHALPVSADCPSDPIAKQGYLRALGLVALLDGGGAKVTVPEAVVVLHAEPDGTVIIDPGLPVNIPHQHLTDMARRAKVFPVVVRDGDVVWAPGHANLGRTRRLASADQRRMLRALYASCLVRGCPVPFDHCEIHHFTEFNDGGPTDIANLGPYCCHHHDRHHDERWQLSMGTRRVITITLPDGQQILCPPNRGGP